MPSNDIPYEKGTPKGWADAARRSFKVGSFEGRWMLSGNCPRCGHRVEKDLTDRIGAALAPLRNISVAWKCSCGRPHDKAPPTEPGCGAEGRIDIEGLPDGP